jgi:WD40 repeat protein
LLAELVGHTGDVRSARFSPDGKLIVTGGDDGTAQVYPCKECGPLGELLAEADRRVPKNPPPPPQKP